MTTPQQHIANRTHASWCDISEHIADGGQDCRVELAEAEGIEVWMTGAYGDEAMISLRNAQGKPISQWPAPILIRVQQALSAALLAKERLT